MGHFKVEIFDKQGFARDFRHLGWAVYAAFAPASDTETFVKIGVSGNVYERIAGIRAGCPFAIEMTLWTYVGYRKVAYRLESALHDAFANRRMSGEWFKFNMASQSDKNEFHAMTKLLFERHTEGGSLAWRKLSAEQISAYVNLATKAKMERRLTRKMDYV